MAEFSIAWWNVENLFDVVGSGMRSERLAKTLAKELIGWDGAVLERKIANISAVIRAMNQGRGPDIIGVCEVENRAVLERLVEAIDTPGRNWQVIHHDMSDNRGIDIAFIYDSKLFYFLLEDVFFHIVNKRNATRDIVQVTFVERKSGRQFIAIGNHWPSRSGGVLESEPYRIVAAETLSYWLSRIQEIKGDIPVIVMGDFNDNPFDRSMTTCLLSSCSPEQVSKSKIPRLFNPMWTCLARAEGTFYYNGEPLVFDQFLVNKACLPAKAPLRVLTDSIDIITPQSLGERLCRDDMLSRRREDCDEDEKCTAPMS